MSDFKEEDSNMNLKELEKGSFLCYHVYGWKKFNKIIKEHLIL